MTKPEAIIGAKAIAEADGIDMVVAFNPYSEDESDSERFGYFPASAARIFTHETIVLKIPGGTG